jgi:hypothetical protein
VARSLRGEDAESFQVEAAGVDAMLRSGVAGGSTRIESRTGIRRHYTRGGALVYRDLPLAPEV